MGTAFEFEAATESTGTEAEAKTEAIAEVKRPGVMIKFYEGTTRDGKPKIFGRIIRRRPAQGDDKQWEDNPWINNLSDLQFLAETAVEGIQIMRKFYKDRESSKDETSRRPA